MLDSAPAWESGAQEEGYFSIYSAPKDPENWHNYVQRVVAHYKGAIVTGRCGTATAPMGFFKGAIRSATPTARDHLHRNRAINRRSARRHRHVAALQDAMTLAAGAYEYYDVLSFHRHDPGMHGYPNDPIDRIAKRLRTAQEKYGKPKPLLFSEGGPDVTVFHGSFFSFAEPALTGDWSWCADQYARMYLTTIASGIQRFFAYSVHNHTHHGHSTHMMVEPGPLPRPLHLTAAALAHFVDGAAYVEASRPAHDISAHVFIQPMTGRTRREVHRGCAANGLDRAVAAAGARGRRLLRPLGQPERAPHGGCEVRSIWWRPATPPPP